MTSQSVLCNEFELAEPELSDNEIYDGHQP